MQKQEEVVPTSAEQDIFLRWLAEVTDGTNTWNPDKYCHKETFGTIFGRSAGISYTYCLGSSHATIEVQSDDPDIKHEFRIFSLYNQGFQVYTTLELNTDELADLSPTCFQPYAKEKLVEFIKCRLQ